MPANLPPQYSKVEEELRRASSPAEKLEKTRELFRLLPKHKGTEKLQAELKQKISRLKEEADSGKSTARKHGLSYRVPREGAGQVVLLGAPNAGKSALLAALTHAHPEVAAYPFTTRAPQPGMMRVHDVDIQLVDLPPISADVMEPWIPSIVRAANAAWLVVSLADDDLVENAQAVINRLAAVHTDLVADLPHESEDEATIHVRTMLVANQADAPGASDRLAILEELMPLPYKSCSVSAAVGTNLDSLRLATYDFLEIMRIYTKLPGRPPDRQRPFTLPIGGSVLDLAREIHRDLQDQIKFARVWGEFVHDGQSVGRDHILHEGDIVEIHT
jgi:ribosome-interacting GTPase 1